MYIILLCMLYMCNGSEVDKKYEFAFNYIDSDSLKYEFLEGSKGNIFVSDTLVFIDKIFFLDEIIDLKNSDLKSDVKKKIRNDEYLKEIEKGKIFKSKKLIALNSFNKKGKTNYILYFSIIENGILLAELFNFPENSSKIKIEDLRMFNTSIKYCFYFDDHGELIKVLKRETHYN